jgi:hypothetical protein
MRLSAGAISFVCPIMQVPTSLTMRSKSVTGRSVRNPGIASSLSSVPPVWPRPRPLTMGTGTPHAATRGASAIEILSPTPPVECLSTLMPGTLASFSTSPEWSIASVSATVSASSSGFRYAAIRNADIW